MKKFFITFLIAALGFLGLGLLAPSADAAVRVGEHFCNSSASDADFIIYPNGSDYSNSKLVPEGFCWTANSGDFSPSNLEIEIYDIGSFRVRNNATSGTYGSCQSTGSDTDDVFHPGNHDRVTFLLYNHSGCKH